MDSTYKLVVPEQYDSLISVELPDKQKYPELGIYHGYPGRGDKVTL
jgi:hypothetical protein